MADIFISYSSSDRELAKQLGSELEERGFSVWWDTNLVSGERFREVITSELSAAGAVIVIWTKDSIKSEWVVSEAQRAARAGKLIPMRSQEVDLAEIPPPFDLRHTDIFSNRSAIFNALEKLSVTPSHKAKSKIVYELGEVFHLGDPTVNFIDRSNTDAFRRMVVQLGRGGRLVRFFGQSKSGKTILCRHAFAKTTPIEVRGRSIDQITDFYQAIAAECGLTAQNLEKEVETFVIRDRRPIVVDDFHQIPTKTQQAIIRRVKPFLDAAITVVLISIPDCAKETILRDGELMDRTVAIAAPKWTDSELYEIVEKGFSALAISVDPSVVNSIVRQSFKNPLLVQDYCCELCMKFDIYRTLSKPRRVSPDEAALSSIFREKANSISGFYQGVITKPSDGKRKLADGSSVSVYALILLAIASVGVLEPLKVSTVARRMQHLLPAVAKQLDQTEVLDLIQELIRRLSGNKSKDYAVLFADKKLTISHPYFKVYLLWKFIPELTGVYPALNIEFDDEDDNAES